MTMTLMAATVVTAICSAAFIGNEASDGRVAEMMGFGHHHMMDDFDNHCPGMGQMMSGGVMQNHTMDRAQCESMMDERGMMQDGHMGRVA